MIFFKKTKDRQKRVVSRNSFSKFSKWCVLFVAVILKFHFRYIDLYSDSKKWRQNDSFLCNTSFLTFCYIQNIGMTFTFQKCNLSHQNILSNETIFQNNFLSWNIGISYSNDVSDTIFAWANLRRSAKFPAHLCLLHYIQELLLVRMT